jgi:hypothetical protein
MITVAVGQGSAGGLMAQDKRRVAMLWAAAATLVSLFGGTVLGILLGGWAQSFRSSPVFPSKIRVR